jgi:phosphoglycolate phosphatase
VSPAPSEKGADRLAGLDVIVFDKDGTLIDFDAMWAPWLTALAGRLEDRTGRPIRETLYGAMGFDPATGRAKTGGLLAVSPMAGLRALTEKVLVQAGVDGVAAVAAVEASWDPPDPVATARPLADLVWVFGAIRARGHRIAIATTDDRAPTEATLASLGAADLVDAIVCADDGIPVKPAPDMVWHLCASLRAEAVRCAVVGDSVADLAMGRAAGAGLVVGVLSGVGTRADLAPFADFVLPSVAALADP